jgi:hypothetical protein
MTQKGNWIETGSICVLFILMCLVGIVWDVTSGTLRSGVDGIMLVAICLMMAGIFALMLLMVMHQAGVLPSFRKSDAKAKK